MELRLEGQRVTLRDWCMEDLPVYRKWLHPLQEWRRWDGPYYAQPTEQQADDAVAALLPRVQSGNWPMVRHRLVIADAATDRLMGVVSWYWESEETNWRRAGITIYEPSIRGRGAGAEALGLWASYLFDETDIRRLDFATWSGNHPMCAVGRKLGWREEGRFRDARVVRGQVHDSVVYGVTRAEWDILRLHSTPESANY